MNEHRTLKYLDPTEIHAPRYDKATIDEDEEEAFSNSIQRNGVIDPIIVSVNASNDRYQLITGERRLYHAKRHHLSEIPCVVWKNADQKAISIAVLVDIAHKQEHSDEEKANAIAGVYQAIGIKPERAIQFVKQLHNGESIMSAKLENIKSKFGRPEEEFMEYYEKIGYSARQQYDYLKLITQLEPEVLHYAEKRRIPQRQKTYLTHSQLNKALDEKKATPQQKIEFKKYLTNKIAGKRISEARDIVHQTIQDVRDGVHDLETGEVRTEQRKETMNRIVTEGEGGAEVAFLYATDGLEKFVKTITAGHLKLERAEIGFDEIPPERIKKVVSTYSLEIIKNLGNRELNSLLERIRFTIRLGNELVEYMENEQEDRSRKKDMIQR